MDGTLLSLFCASFVSPPFALLSRAHRTHEKSLKSRQLLFNSLTFQFSGLSMHSILSLFFLPFFSPKQHTKTRRIRRRRRMRRGQDQRFLLSCAKKKILRNNFYGFPLSSVSPLGFLGIERRARWRAGEDKLILALRDGAEEERKVHQDACVRIMHNQSRSIPCYSIDSWTLRRSSSSLT